MGPMDYDASMRAAPIYLAADIRRIEAAAGALVPSLMERAAAAAAEIAAGLASQKNKDILVLAGPGNNGGDARLVAERMRARFSRVTLATRPAEIPMDRS
jgi:NAD(P)H-hydrate repair Nnr-like enzyme with NAD(P)H-hydrate epimerase domain